MRALRNKNLDEASFNDKVEVVAKMGIEIYPTENLKSMEVKCRLGENGLANVGMPLSVGGSPPSKDCSMAECGKVSSAPLNTYTAERSKLPALPRPWCEESGKRRANACEQGGHMNANSRRREMVLGARCDG